jgi:hypothetical protein
MVKAGLPEPKSPGVLYHTHRSARWMTMPLSCLSSTAGDKHLLGRGRCPVSICKGMSWAPTSCCYVLGHGTWDRLRARAYGDGGLIVVVRVMPHQGAWESHAQGEAVQGDGLAEGSARDVHWLNWRKAATGEPCDAETVTHGSERDRGKRASDGTSPAVYSTSW